MEDKSSCSIHVSNNNSISTSQAPLQLNSRLLSLFEESNLTDVTFHVGPYSPLTSLSLATYVTNGNHKPSRSQQQHGMATSSSSNAAVDTESPQESASFHPDATPIRAHRAILSIASPVFAAMFSPSFQSATDYKSQLSIAVPDVPPRGLSALFRALYSDHTEFRDTLESAETLVAAKKYLVPHVTQECYRQILCCTDLGTILQIFPIVYSIQEDTLIHFCLRSIDLSFEEIPMNLWTDLDLEMLHAIVGRDSLMASEFNILQVCAEWANTNGKSLEETQLIHHIRFPLIPIEHLVTSMGLYGLPSLKQMAAILESWQRPNLAVKPRNLAIDSGWNLTILFDQVSTNEPKQQSITQSPPAKTARTAVSPGDGVMLDLYGAVDIQVNQKFFLGGVRLFASQQRIRNRITCFPNQSSLVLRVSQRDTAGGPQQGLGEFHIDSLEQDTGRAFVPTMDGYLKESVVLFPGLWYRLTLHMVTPHLPAFLSSDLTPVVRESNLQVDVSSPSGHGQGDTNSGTLEKPALTAQPPLCRFLCGLHYRIASDLLDELLVAVGGQST